MKNGSVGVEERWTVTYDPANERIQIVAEGFATAEKSKPACSRFVALLGSKTVDLVVDLDRMTGYTSEARRAWQECFYPVRAQLMGATVVAAFSGIPVQFFASHEALNEGASGRARPGR
jgi:hypothetical protein